MLVKRLKELVDESKRDKVWDSLNDEIKGAVENLIKKLAVEINDR